MEIAISFKEENIIIMSLLNSVCLLTHRAAALSGGVRERDKGVSTSLHPTICSPLPSPRALNRLECIAAQIKHACKVCTVLIDLSVRMNSADELLHRTESVSTFTVIMGMTSL